MRFICEKTCFLVGIPRLNATWVGFLRGVILIIFWWPVSGFGGSGPPVVLTPDEDGIQRVTIVMESYSFSPNEIIVQANTPVSIRLENHSFLVPHNFVIDNPQMDLHHEINVSAGDSVNLQLLLTTPGTYTFYCDKKLLFFPSHREEGMEGHLEVR